MNLKEKKNRENLWNQNMILLKTVKLNNSTDQEKKTLIINIKNEKNDLTIDPRETFIFKC